MSNHDPSGTSSTAERQASAIAGSESPDDHAPRDGPSDAASVSPSGPPSTSPPSTPPAPASTSPATPSSPPASPGSAPHPSPPPTPKPGGPAQPGFIERLPWWAVPAFLIGVPLLAWAAVQASPDLYEDVVWESYWGPIKADAHGFETMCLGPDGDFGDRETGYPSCVAAGGTVAESGYNYVNTASWAVLMLVCIVGAAQMLRRFAAPMGPRLIVGATLWVVAGSVFHALEDTGLLAPPLQYLFITPPIYLLFAAFGIASFLIGKHLEDVQAKAGLSRAIQKLWLIMAIVPILALLMWLYEWDQFVRHLNPAIVVAFWAATFVGLRAVAVRKDRIDATDIVIGFALPAIATSLAYVFWYERDPWPPGSQEGMPLAFLWAPLLALAGTLVVLLLPRKAKLGLIVVGGSILAGAAAVLLLRALLGQLGARLGIEALTGAAGRIEGRTGFALAAIVTLYVLWRWWRSIKPSVSQELAATATAFRHPINLLIVFAQLTDGFATALGIDFRGYQEKHVLSENVINWGRSLWDGVGWEWGADHATVTTFVPIKLVVSLLVVYAMDVRTSEESERQQTLIGLAKFAIIMVGLGPGVRDFMRLSMGV